MKKILIVVICLLFLFTAPLYLPLFLSGVGGRPSKADRIDYARRAANFFQGKFHNESDVKVMVKADDIDKGRLSTKDTRPKETIPVIKSEITDSPGSNDFSLVWLGHSSLLIQAEGKNILIDPVFSQKLSPVSWIGVNRFSQSPLNVEDLPVIDLLILSHDHYDHLDYKVVKKLSDKVKKVILPLGVECHLRRWKFDMSKVENMAWWEEKNIDGLFIACTPAQHFSGRWLTGRNETLWASWVLRTENRQIFYNGDSGFGNHYASIHEKYGDFDLAIMECGQYNPRWAKIHSFPEEGVEAMKILGAKITLPVHWGAFVLSNHPWDDSIERFVLCARKNDLPYISPRIGQVVDLNQSDLQAFQKNWWQNIQ